MMLILQQYYQYKHQEETDDQRMLTIIAEKYGHNLMIEIDITDELFMVLDDKTIRWWKKQVNINDHSKFDVRNNQIISKQCNKTPCVIHAPFSLNMDPIVQLYDLPKGYITKSPTGSLFSRARHYIPYLKLEISIILMLITVIWVKIAIRYSSYWEIQ